MNLTKKQKLIIKDSLIHTQLAARIQLNKTIGKIERASKDLSFDKISEKNELIYNRLIKKNDRHQLLIDKLQSLINKF